MAVFNEERYVAEAIESILQQTFEDFEFVIVDDGSVDQTPMILKGYADPRLRVFHQTNQGQSQALNRGIRLSTGAYIARMDGDDVARLERLEKEVRVLDTHPEVGLVGTWCTKIDAETGREWLQRLPREDAVIRKFLVVDNPFIHSSVMIRKAVLDRIGLYDEKLIWQDYDLWVRIARYHRVVNVPEPLVMRRKHPGSVTRTSKKSREFWDLFKIQLKAAVQMGLRSEGVAAMTRSLSKAMRYRLYGR
jgi:glycosyltransferase involved in cell wall biosynthesis